ncbi:VOC family protein [Gordonia sp. CPCC 205515]|uniref:VOC family protein n=1 Tax=Gordonia sp. CPCC 205515 TaxID=3140791 RepID=UPI003AF37D84
MTTPDRRPPATTGLNHFSATVRDLERSVEWYMKVLGLQRLPVEFPHYGDEQGGYAVLLVDPSNGFLIGLHHHESHQGDAFDESRTGLDHLAWGVESRAALDEWAGWLDEVGVEHSGVIDVTEPMPYSVVVFRDPDNIQLELVHAAV